MLLLRILLLILPAVSCFSLLLPFTHRLNLPPDYGLDEIKPGYEALTPYPALLLMITACAFLLFGKSRKIIDAAFILSCVHCLFMLIVRAENHFQGIMASKDYDTMSGSGFFLFGGCSLAFFIVALICLIKRSRNQPKRKWIEGLLDNPDVYR
jgi:hypothetical protein